MIGGEALYRQNDAAKGTTSTKIFGGILDLNYAFSDVWDGTLKYSILRPNNGGGTSDALLSTMAPVANALVVAKGYIQEISVSPAYQITDGAKFRAEYKLDWTKYSGFSKNLTHTVLGMFEYAF